MQGQRISYIGASTFDQNPERQREQIQLDNQFIDKASGKDTKRPELDHLARNLDDLRQIVPSLTLRSIRIEFVKERLTFTGKDSPMAHLMLSVMGEQWS